MTEGDSGLFWPSPTSLNEQIRRCHQRTIECARKALNAGIADDARNEFLPLERDRLARARSGARHFESRISKNEVP